MFPVVVPVLNAAATVFAHALIKTYVKGDIGQEFATELVALVKEPSRLLGEKTEADRVQGVADKIVKDMGPLFKEARASLATGSVAQIAGVVALSAVRANLGSELLVDKNLDPEAVRAALFTEAKKERARFTVDEVDFLYPILQELAYRITDMATLLSGFNLAFSREVLERLSDALEELAKLRAEREERGESVRIFEAEYRKAVRIKLDRLDYIGSRKIDDHLSDQSLSKSYVSLEVEPYRGEGGTEPHAGLRPSGPASVDDVLERGKMLVVRGDAGAGKTTLLQWIGVQTASAEPRDRPAGWGEVVPFFLRLRDLGGKDFPGPADLTSLSAPLAGEPPSPDWALRLLRSGRALLLIDGVDELRETDRDRMLEGLKDLVEQFPMGRYIISSRSHALNEKSWPAWSRWVEGSGFTQVTIRPMGPEQIARFLDRWHTAAARCYPEPDNQAKWPGLSASLSALLARPDMQSLRKLAATPLLCSMICALHVEYGDDLPSSRVDLYREFLTTLLGDRETKRHIPSKADYPRLPMEDRHGLAQAFAYHMMEQGVLEMPILGVDAFFDSQVKHKKRERPTGKGVRLLFTDRCSLLRDSGGLIDFRHKTFQEFLAADYAARKPRIDLAAHASDTAWRETILWASALFDLEECDALLRKLISSPPENPKPFTTALACLLSDNVSDAVHAEVVAACRRLFPPTLETAVDVAAGGDPAVPFLEPAPSMDAVTRAACIRALSAIGTPTALAAIERHAGAPAFAMARSNDPVWLDFVRELGSGREPFDRDEYVQRVLKPLRWLIPDVPNGSSPPALSDSSDSSDKSDRSNLSDSDPQWRLIAHLIGRGSAPGPNPAAPRCWALWLAASIAEEQEQLGDAGIRVALRDNLVTLISTPQALPPRERALCGRVLSKLGDTRPGVGLRPDGLPDIEWCDVPAGKFVFGGDDQAYNSGQKRIIDLPAFRIAKYPVTYCQFQAFVQATDGYGNPRWWEGLHEDAQKQRQAGPHEQRFPFDNHPREMVS
ncbi:MAG: NACHT domain-containing protein, partial [Capsulimonadaceae bacterium]